MSVTVPIYVCIVCGSRSKDAHGFDKIDPSFNVDPCNCSDHCARCMPEVNESGDWVLAESVEDVQKRLRGE